MYSQNNQHSDQHVLLYEEMVGIEPTRSPQLCELRGNILLLVKASENILKWLRQKKKEKAKINNRENNDIDYNNSTI